MFTSIIVVILYFLYFLKMIKLKYIVSLLVLGAFFTNCAKRGTITGGPKDTIAPKIIGSFPANFSTQFKGNEIKITFDELIKVKVASADRELKNAIVDAIVRETQSAKVQLIGHILVIYRQSPEMKIALPRAK